MRCLEWMRVRGCNVLRAYENMWGDILGLDSICSVCEYQDPLPLADIARKLEAQVIYGRTDITIWGYTVIDSMKAIVEIASRPVPEDLWSKHGSSPDIYRRPVRQIAHGGRESQQPQARCCGLAGTHAGRCRSGSCKDRRGRKHSSFDDTFFY